MARASSLVTATDIQLGLVAFVGEKKDAKYDFRNGRSAVTCVRHPRASQSNTGPRIYVRDAISASACHE